MNFFQLYYINTNFNNVKKINNIFNKELLSVSKVIDNIKKKQITKNSIFYKLIEKSKNSLRNKSKIIS